MSAEALNKVGTAYKLYSAVYPALRAWTMLDHLIPFSPGYMMVAWARRRRPDMCGIVGRAGPAPVSEPEILRMCDAIGHRGPDDWGAFVEGGLGLGMRRLSIIDLAGGHQPLANEDGSVVVVFNGELYNYPELRAELVAKGHRFSTRSDTEVLVHLYEEDGERMVAPAARHVRLCHLGPNPPPAPAGARPLRPEAAVLHRVSGTLTFASEIKALLADDPSLAELSPRALDQYLTMRFVQPPETFFSAHPCASSGALHGLGERPRAESSATGT